MGVSFLPEHLQVGGWANESKSSTLLLLMLRLFLFECVSSSFFLLPAGIFHFPPFHLLFSPLNKFVHSDAQFTELMTADDY